MSLATIPPMQAVGPQDTAELLVDCKNDAQLCSGVNCAENCKEELCSCCCGDNLNGGAKYSRAWFGKLVKINMLLNMELLKNLKKLKNTLALWELQRLQHK